MRGKAFSILKNIFCVLMFLLFLSDAAQAQYDLRDTLREAFSQRPKMFFQIDSYNSFVRSRKANAWGFKTGFDFGKKLRLGMGFSVLSTDAIDKIAVGDTAYRGEIKSSYFTSGIEYVIYRKGPWQVSLPAHIGLGSSYYEYPNGKKRDNRAYEHNIILFEPAITGHYKIVKWVGVGFGVGYRIMLLNNPDIPDKLSSPLYVLRLKIFLDEVYRSIFPKKEESKKPSTKKN